MKRLSYKNGILLGLIGLSIVLTSQLLYDRKYSVSNLITFEDESVEKKIKDIDKYLNPQSFSISFGGGFHTVLFSDIAGVWSNSKDIVKNNYINPDEEFKKINYDEWEDVFKERSIKVNMPFVLENNLVSQYLSLANNEGEKGISFDQLIIPISGQFIYYGDTSSGEFYKKVLSADLSYINGFVDNIEGQKNTRYQTVESYFSLEKILETEDFTENITLIPVSRYKGIPRIKAIREVDIAGTDFETDAKNIANKAFGKNFDFVKKMEDYDGSLVYVYGYGEKALRIGANGSVEYTEKIGEDYSGSDISHEERIKIALETISKYGDMPSNVYLSDYKMLEAEGQNVYLIEFDYKINDVDVVNSVKPEKSPITVRIYKDRVINFNKNIRKYVKTIAPIGSKDEVIKLPFDILNTNFKDISLKFNKNNREKLANFEFDNYSFLLLQNIEKIRQCYFVDIFEGEETIRNAWEIKIGVNTFYFDMFTGELLTDVVE
ncbi:MAG: hypothetical protein N4A76_11765 [Firmicutes bacterium]|jgi:hypothetical protein|nr:hypothetical protein [Bacillota bacterium]